LAAAIQRHSSAPIYSFFKKLNSDSDEEKYFTRGAVLKKIIAYADWEQDEARHLKC
jgi:hypothetical protein